MPSNNSDKDQIVACLIRILSLVTVTIYFIVT